MTCAPAGRPGPHLYEGTFAHEWQHLLQYYTDPIETTWLNEGLSDFAQTLTGYVDGTSHGLRPGRRQPPVLLPGLRHRCRRRSTPTRATAAVRRTRSTCGARAAPSAVLADYGNAYSLMLYLYDRYGTDIISRLHRDGELQGLASLDAALNAEGAATCTRCCTTSRP